MRIETNYPVRGRKLVLHFLNVDDKLRIETNYPVRGRKLNIVDVHQAVVYD